MLWFKSKCRLEVSSALRAIQLLECETQVGLRLRVRGSYKGDMQEIAAHSSAIQIQVGERPIFSATEMVSSMNTTCIALHIDTSIKAEHKFIGRIKQRRAK